MTEKGNSFFFFGDFTTPDGHRPTETPTGEGDAKTNRKETGGSGGGVVVVGGTKSEPFHPPTGWVRPLFRSVWFQTGSIRGGSSHA